MPEQFFGMNDGIIIGWLAGEKKPFPMFAPKVTKVPRLWARALPNPYFKD
jgi:hypothetical protein